MVRFENNVERVLPYNREKYLNFLDDDFKGIVDANWFGISLQLESIRNQKLYSASSETITQSIDILESTFKSLVSHLDQDCSWIVNHDDKDMSWFRRDDEKLLNLRNIFTGNGIPQTFQGCLILFKDDLVALARDFVMYPYALSYKNVDISHSKLPIVIKITGHLTIDLLSTDKMLLHNLVSHNSLSPFTQLSYTTR